LRADRVGFGEDAHDLRRGSVGGDIVVGGLALEKQIADAASGEEGLMAAVAEGTDDGGSELARVGHAASV
jgi:hypothetical protein